MTERLTAGDAAPAFSLPDADGKPVAAVTASWHPLTED